MKLLFFFFLFLPSASALAVSPTSLDLTDGFLGLVYVYNTLNQEVFFEIDGLHRENFTLAAGEKRAVEVSVQGERPGQYEGELIIKEISEDGFINAIVIPVEYSGSIPRQQEKKWNKENIASIIVLSTILLLCGGYFYKKKKNKYKEEIKKFKFL